MCIHELKQKENHPDFFIQVYFLLLISLLLVLLRFTSRPSFSFSNILHAVFLICCPRIPYLSFFTDSLRHQFSTCQHYILSAIATALKAVESPVERKESDAERKKSANADNGKNTARPNKQQERKVLDKKD